MHEPRQVTVAALHDLINHPDVRPFVGAGDEDLDITHRLRGALFYGDPAAGGVLFILAAPHVYETHFLFTKALRGKPALQVCRDAVRHVFTAYDAEAIVGSIPLSHRASRLFAAAIRAEKVAEQQDSSGRPCAVYMLERKRWAT